jgi:small subunit ribosomal protein S17
MSTEQGNRKTRVGVVVSDKMDKTVVVRVDNIVKHSVYKKFIKRRVTCKAHDERNECAIGDKVLIVETRPLSKDKRWRVREILEKNPSV